MTNTAEHVTTTRQSLTIDMWTDLGCPWCYLGKHRLQEALTASGASVELVLHSYQLHPEAPHGVIETVPAIAARVHGITTAEAHRIEDRTTAMANAEGLPFTIDRPVSNTFDVHRLLQLAKYQGVGTDFFATVELEYFAGRLNPFDPDSLVAKAVAAGVPESAATHLLGSDEFSDEVLADIDQARLLGITGVPFTVYGNRFATAGAQSIKGYGNAFTRAIAELNGDAS